MDGLTPYEQAVEDDNARPFLRKRLIDLLNPCDGLLGNRIATYDLCGC